MYIEPLQLLILVATLFVAIVGTYAALVLHRVLRTMRTVNMITDLIDKLRNVQAIFQNVPLESIRHGVERWAGVRNSRKASNK